MNSAGPILTRDAVREADRRASRLPGLPTMLLMENAGRGLADVTSYEALGCGSVRIEVLAGGGNNGGDGLVAARHLVLRGWRVRILLASPGGKFDPESDPGRNLESARALGLSIEEITQESALRRAAASMGPGTLLVDALLGTGLMGPPRAPLSRTLEWMSRAGHPVVAADIPSGLDADSGETHGPVPACLATATFLALKPGLLRGRGPELAGRITVCDIGVPLEALAPPGTAGRSEAGESPA